MVDKRTILEESCGRQSCIYEESNSDYSEKKGLYGMVLRLEYICNPSTYYDDSFYDFIHWYVAVEPIPMSDVLRIEDLVTQEVLYEAEDAKYE